jgi:tetratricopeptide (TPR) repeat protein
MVQKIDPADHDAAAKVRQLAASSTIKKGNYEDSEKVGEQIRSAARGGDVFADSGGAETPEGKLRKEIAQLEAKTQADPGNAALYTQIGHLHRKLEDFDQAAAAYQKSLDATGGADFDVKGFLLDAQIDKLRKNRKILKDRIDQLDPANPDPEKEKKLKAQFNAYNDEIINREVE